MRLFGRFASGILAAVLCALAVPSLATDAVRVVETITVPRQPPPPSGASHDLRLSLVVFQGTRWKSGEIVPAVQEAARLLAQCGIVLAGAELRLLEAPREFHFYSTPVSRSLLRDMEVAKPALFFVEDTRNRPAYDAEAIALANSATRPELANTVWVAYGARDLAHALAHELVHVLADSGDHSDAPGNLMQPETSPRNTQLSDAQCARLRSQGAAHGLLSPGAR